MRTHLMMACLMIAGPVLADPATPPDSYVEIRILDSESKVIASSTDQETIRFAVNAMERASNVGSNAYQMSLTHYLHLVPPRQEKPGPTRDSRWYLDINTGNFALVSPPKLVICKFRKADFATLKKRLKLNVEQPSPAPPATKPADKAPVKDQPTTSTSEDAPR